MAHRTDEFQTIRSEGGLLPPDLLRRVIDPKAKLAGTRPEDYGLPQNERLNEVITQSWNRLQEALGRVPRSCCEPARRRRGNRPNQRQVEPATVAGAGLRPAAHRALDQSLVGEPTRSAASSGQWRCILSASVSRSIAAPPASAVPPPPTRTVSCRSS